MLCQSLKLHLINVSSKGHKKVAMDVQNRWNSTFKMLDTAIPLKEAFERLGQIDKNYKHNPSEEDWQVAVVVHDCLKLFYDATCHFSGTNFLIEIFLHTKIRSSDLEIEMCEVLNSNPR